MRISALLILAVAGCLDPAPEVRKAAATVDVCSGIADGALCNDQNTCTTGDKCAGGICVGLAAVNGTACTDGNQCTSADSCNQGLCSGSPVPEGTLCTDGEPCTGPDTCQLGLCKAGGNVVCDDGIACTIDSCLMGMGCRFATTPACPDGNVSDTADAVPAADRPGLDVSDPPDGSGSSDVSAPPDGIPGDAGGPDRDDAATDTATDTGMATDTGDGGGQVDGDVGGDVDGDSDARDAGDGNSADGPEGRDGDARDAGDTGPDGAPDDALVRLFQVRGGACSCTLAEPPSKGLGFLIVGLAVALLRVRRRTPRAAA